MRENGLDSDHDRCVLFLDIDGVLNGHDYDSLAKSSTIRRGCVHHLNRVILETGCEIVIISAWRYMVLKGEMTLRGFNYLLQTHGIRCPELVIGVTREDETTSGIERAVQVKEWLMDSVRVKAYAIADDLDLGYAGMNYVQTEGQNGLTEYGANRLIELLRTPCCLGHGN